VTLILTLVIGLLVAFANGANDNFKGVATLFGSGSTSYRTALAWASATTALGSLAALMLAQGLITAFEGRGLVPASVVADAGFPLAVAFAAGGTVLAATRFGFPISTTHALIGGMVGAGLVRSAAGIDLGALGGGLLLPLLTSPLIALLLALLVYPITRRLRERLRVTPQTCVCVGSEVVAVLDGRLSASQVLASGRLPSLTVADQIRCDVSYEGRMIGLSANALVTGAHFLSSGAVSFARGVNDTPKIAALLLAGSLLPPEGAVVLVGAAILVGGLVYAKRVAETMSHGITDLSPGQGLTANLVTAALVIGASRLGMPVSTTHVSCGALFGIGASSGRAHWKTIAQIGLAWLITLPVAAAIGAAFAWLVPLR
jgi:PiT family inorganic phosphate transporter